MNTFKIILTAGALALSFTATASDFKKNHSTCSNYADMAGNISDIRNNGVPMSEFVQYLIDSDVTDELTHNLVRQVYEMPRYNTDEYKANQRTEFTTNTYIQCLDALQGGK